MSAVADILDPGYSLFHRYGQSPVRYTTYPAPLTFSDEAGGAHFRRAIERSNDQLIPPALALSVSIPFCRSLCYYCDRDKKVTRRKGLVAHYLEALQQDIAHKAAWFDEDRVVTQMHWHGGTPNYLAAGQRDVLMRAIARHFTLAEPHARDFSIALDPRHTAPSELAGLTALGFNRVSLEVPELDMRVQRAINRVCPPSRLGDVVMAARDAGISSVCVRLMLGLPEQTLDGLSPTLRRVIELRPELIGIRLFRAQPDRFPAQRLLAERALPEGREVYAMRCMVTDSLQKAGYVPVDAEHFALAHSPMASVRRHHGSASVLRGDDGGDIIGFGAGALSVVGGDYFQSEVSVERYVQQIDGQAFERLRGYRCSAGERRIGAVIAALVSSGCCEKIIWERRFGGSFNDHFRAARERLRPLIADGLVEDNARVVAVTSAGWPFLHAIAACFDQPA